MSKVVIISNDANYTYNFRKEIIKELIAQGNLVYIVLPPGDRVADLSSLGCECIAFPYVGRGKNPFSDYMLYKKYYRVLKNIKPDIVFTFTIKPNIYGGLACKSLGIPYVVNITGLGTAVENGGVMQKITTTLYRRALKNVQTVFFQNEENRKFFETQKIALGRHKLLPGSGVNLNQFQILDYPEETITEFVYISRIMKQKGIDQYLEAAKVIKSKYPNTVFHVCGSIEEVEYGEILEDLHNSGIIQYHGKLKDVRDILKQTHCTVHPTYYPEGLSNVLLESAASGRPLIATDRSGCREIVDGSNGYLVSPGDSEDLIDKIENFISLTPEQQKKMGRNARIKVENEFDREIVVKEYLNEIEK